MEILTFLTGSDLLSEIYLQKLKYLRLPHTTQRVGSTADFFIYFWNVRISRGSQTSNDSPVHSILEVELSRINCRDYFVKKTIGILIYLD